MGQKYGYIRVSTKEQNPERQYVALEEMQIERKNIFLDKISGKNFLRPSYCRMIKKLKKGDLVVIKSIDRLGRDYGEILEQWRIITREIGADIKVIDMPLLDTRCSREDLMGVFIADLVLQILAYVAETERAFIKQRQAEGIALAKEKGKKIGRCKNKLPERFEVYCEMWQQGVISTRKAAKELGISHTTFYRRCMEAGEKNCNKS